MADQLPHDVGSPPTLVALFDTAPGAEQDEAWSRFVSTYSGLLLHTCHTIARDHDAAMDGYVYVLDALREQDCRRLRAYRPLPGVSFTTWLVVVARRLLLDFQRQRYGRPRSEDTGRRAEHDARRRLEDLVGAEIDVDRIQGPDRASADRSVRQRELAGALRQALDELPPSDRLLLALRFGDERPAREIAATIGFPTAFHVYRRLASVLAGLKVALLRRGVDESTP